MNEARRYWIGVMAMLLLGVVFVASGISKLFLQSGVSHSLFLGFLPMPLANAIYVVLPYVELTVGILLLLGIGIRFATSLVAFLITSFVISNIFLITQGLGAESCQCFGVLGQLTVAGALGADILMAALVAAIFVCYRGSYFNITPLVLTNGHNA